MKKCHEKLIPNINKDFIMKEDMQEVKIEIPTSLRQELTQAMNHNGVQVTNKRIIDALRFAFSSEIIPFSDAPSNEPEMATKVDVEELRESLTQQYAEIDNALNRIWQVLDDYTHLLFEENSEVD
jgi:hypothetical protein